ncbi:hypothetical protein C0033_08480 [Clostridium sp. chh4-2]|uniref:helix-turn-helix domain-containing protein n=1 Tax=Clostridium sp. chh4-2 TaxID=2067550 RepID=UPI000CCE54FF|nr:helix-turn-helix transcriptional regulator [Clostridium sp. chh4-2]PNV62585.1 hypothetical protein C0033_08480 [Clostridium sp. chh4-2]
MIYNDVKINIRRGSWYEWHGRTYIKLRKYLGLTQAEFSFPLGIKNSLLSKLERGNLELDEAKAKRIAEFYGVSISWIQNGEEPMFQEPADKKQIKEQILDSIQSFQEWISDCPRQSLPGYGERLMSVRNAHVR